MSSCQKCLSLTNHIVKRSFQLNSKQFQQPKIRREDVYGPKYKTIPIGGYIFLTIPITTFGLGVWQVQRMKWKEDLVEQLNRKTNKPPIDFPDDLSEINNLEYRTVKVQGHFDHSRETFIGPRSLLTGGDSQPSGGLVGSSGQSGFYVVTPFKLSNRDLEILVNRGWVTREQLKPSTRKEGQISHDIILEGVVRLTEARPTFVPKNKGGNIWTYRDLNEMSAALGTSPIFLDATYDSSVPGGPIGGQTRITLRNEHLSYILTWFGISAGSSYLWWKQFILKRS